MAIKNGGKQKKHEVECGVNLTLVRKNKMKPTNPNAHTYVNGTDVKTHGYEVKHNTFLQSFI